MASYSCTHKLALGHRHIHDSKAVRAKQLVSVTVNHRLHMLWHAQPPDNAHDHKAGRDASALAWLIQCYLQPGESLVLDMRSTLWPCRSLECLPSAPLVLCQLTHQWRMSHVSLSWTNRHAGGCYDTLLNSLIVHVPSFTHAWDSFSFTTTDDTSL